MNKRPPKQNTKKRDSLSWIGDDFPSLKFSDPFHDIFKPMPYWKLIKKANKTLAWGKILMAKHDSAIARCANRTKLVPTNATIRKEYVKCTKPNCYRKKHGPYYYAYWKDPITKKLRKKYIGRHFDKANLSASVEQTEKGTLAQSQLEFCKSETLTSQQLYLQSVRKSLIL